MLLHELPDRLALPCIFILRDFITTLQRLTRYFLALSEITFLASLYYARHTCRDAFLGLLFDGFFAPR